LIRIVFRESTPFDWILLVILTLLSLSGILIVKTLYPEGNRVTIEVKGRKVYLLSLVDDRMVTVEGPLGKTTIQVKGGRVRVVDSPCPEKICIRQGWIKSGVIVCLPNRVVVTVGKGDHGEIDAISG
jgi:hypothetical protein